MTNVEIEKLAEKVFKDCGGKAPIDVVLAAKKYGLEIHILQMEKVVGSDNPSGVLAEKQGHWYIVINDADSFTRQRFTIAHELGHFLIHKGREFVDEFSAGETFYRDGRDTTEEHQANYFAACLLMPAGEVERIWPECKDPKDAAKRFKVSEVSMTYRLKTLGLIFVEE